MAARTTQIHSLALRTQMARHEHAVCVYDSERKVILELDQFLRQGLVAGEVTTFVNTFAHADEARSTLALEMPDVPARCDTGDLLLAHHRDAFERGGIIDPIHASMVVDALVKESRERGRAGARFFVDASTTYIASGRTDEWFAFEAWLGRRLKADTSLVCAYDANDVRDPDVLARVLATHAYRYESSEIREL